MLPLHPFGVNVPRSGRLAIISRRCKQRQTRFVGFSRAQAFAAASPSTEKAEYLAWPTYSSSSEKHLGRLRPGHDNDRENPSHTSVPSSTPRSTCGRAFITAESPQFKPSRGFVPASCMVKDAVGGDVLCMPDELFVPAARASADGLLGPS